MIINETEKLKCKKKPFNSVGYTTGDIDLNIDRFNQAMGTTEGDEVGIGSEGSLCEAKRYVRRYYFRPMNTFASNKAEIIKKLIEIGDQNCTIYTLNNLGDEKDVSKLTSNDIIYTYDNGILKDKNGVRIMDYDLSIKKEEERKKFTDVDKASDKEFIDAYQDRMTDHTVIEALDLDFEDTLTITPRIFMHANKQEYEDRMTDATELEENLIHEAFSLDFDSYNVFGEKLTEAKETICSICGEPIEGIGHNTADGIVCDGCDLHFAIGG